jgi:hypothetical protein
MSRARSAEREPAPMPPARSLAIPIEAIDWARIAADLDAHGCATTGRLLSAQQCTELAETYATDAPFRNRVVMARHGFGRGEYKYFAYPLPEPVAVLRAALYPPLAEIANRWNQAMAIDLRYPPSTRVISRAAAKRDRPSRRRCCCSTAPATTIACTKISTASTCFRCKSRCCYRGRATISPAASSCSRSRDRACSRGPRSCPSRKARP